MIDGYDDNFSTTVRTTDRPIYVKLKPIDKPGIYITSKWLDEKKDQYANVFIDDKPLIRCKDCKWFDESNDNDLSCRYFYEAMSADDFCSRGEKRDE